MLLSLEVEKMNLKRFPGGGGDFEKDCKIMELSLATTMCKLSTVRGVVIHREE